MTIPNGQHEKEFDCVEMKRCIQEELARQQAGLTRDDLNAAALRRIAADPHLKRLAEAAAKQSPTRKAG